MVMNREWGPVEVALFFQSMVSVKVIWCLTPTGSPPPTSSGDQKTLNHRRHVTQSLANRGITFQHPRRLVEGGARDPGTANDWQGALLGLGVGARIQAPFSGVYSAVRAPLNTRGKQEPHPSSSVTWKLRQKRFFFSPLIVQRLWPHSSNIFDLLSHLSPTVTLRDTFPFPLYRT